MGGPETIFQSPKQSKVIRSIAIKGQHAVHHMLKHFGTCDIAVFRYVTNEDHSDVVLFC
ncbi:hypothetical protein D3C87_1227800 [compost metagenome]